jgi:hypothetical protein
MDKAPPREANHRVAGSTPAMRRFRDVAYVPSSNEPAALRGGGLFFGRELREPRFRLVWRADPGRPGPLGPGPGVAVALSVRLSGSASRSGGQANAEPAAGLRSPPTPGCGAIQTNKPRSRSV